MWKFQDLYEKVMDSIIKKANPPVVGEAKLPFDLFQWTPDGRPERNFWNLPPTDEILTTDLHTTAPDNTFIEEQREALNLEWLERMKNNIYKEIGWNEPEISMVDEYGDVAPPHIQRRYEQGGAYEGGITDPMKVNYAQCDKCDPKNILFYDTRVYDSCPRCKELREEIPEFLSESDMEL